MRLIGAGEPDSLIAADISASLRGLGRGNETAGGIVLLHVKPQGCRIPFDAVVVTPYGVLLVSGVELPGPTMRLTAPLYGQWQADDWPLVGSGDAINPGASALAASRHLAQRIAQQTELTLPVATVLAVGPFVDSVTPGEDDLDQPVRVLYPTINGFRDAIAALTPPRPQPCSAEQARAVLRAIDPTTPIQPDTTLATEGFPSAMAYAQRPVPGRPGPGPGQLPHHQPCNDSRQRSMLRRPLPLAVVCLLVVGLVAMIAVATAGASDSPTDTGASLPDLVIHDVDGLDFQVMAADTDRRCARNAYGDLRTAVADADCDVVHMGSYLAGIDDSRVAISMAVFEFSSPKQANRIDTLVTTKGTGWALDLATARDAWPDASGVGTTSYRSTTSGAKLRLVRAVWLAEPDRSETTSLVPVIQRAFAIPTPDGR